MIFPPPIYIGYSRPNSPATFFNAACMAVLFSGFEKSTKGSLVNSDVRTVVSAIAIQKSPGTPTIHSTVPGNRGTTKEPSNHLTRQPARTLGPPVPCYRPYTPTPPLHFW